MIRLQNGALIISLSGSSHDGSRTSDASKEGFSTPTEKGLPNMSGLSVGRKTTRAQGILKGQSKGIIRRISSQGTLNLFGTARTSVDSLVMKDHGTNQQVCRHLGRFQTRRSMTSASKSRWVSKTGCAANTWCLEVPPCSMAPARVGFPNRNDLRATPLEFQDVGCGAPP